MVTDASGTLNETTHDAAWRRMAEAGAQRITSFGVACELNRDWRNSVTAVGPLFANHIPEYRNLISSHQMLKAVQ